MLDFTQYDKTTRKISFKLRSGLMFSGEYYENYMTEANLLKFRKAQDEVTEKNGDIVEMHQAYQVHLANAMAKIPAKMNGKVLPDSTVEERIEIIKLMSFQDVREVVSRIAEDLGRPFEQDENDSSSGQEMKEESVPASETKTAT